ncbi:hypothetical protein IC619_002585 [Hazenella sp. IB182353]|uniref:hypothetical protein n=1 Tax=Polycladospora coralii TaxID=2771432 RepID=UPI00174621FA|nr:hypothetical protein [Polycladospora coralii]MBS7529383.1 hypothetical protein [Polycladospora coralii]
MNNVKDQHKKRQTQTFSQIKIEQFWPILDRETLAWIEIKQDPHYALLSHAQIKRYVLESIQYGEAIAKQHTSKTQLKTLLNLLLQQGVQIKFIDLTHEKNEVRARYIRKPATIEIFRSSLIQIEQFFNKMGYHLSIEDLILLHVYHEWFHHLEETVIERTDETLPRILVKQTGPFKRYQTIAKTREIAAHTFTQHLLPISWSPLLIDQLLLLSEKNVTKPQIREKFQELKQQAKTIFKEQ